jgi:galactose mutarotase-like enzyme
MTCEWGGSRAKLFEAWRFYWPRYTGGGVEGLFFKMQTSLGRLEGGIKPMSDSVVRIENAARTAFMEAVPSRGGIVTHWNLQGQEILYLDEARFADPTLSVRGGIPILFPICGNLPGNVYAYEDQTFQLKQHGFARDLPWAVVGQTPTSLDIALESGPQTLALYPFEFGFKITYALEGDSLMVRSHITNRSTQTMPFSLGFHPYFAVKDKSKLTFDLPASQAFNHLTQQRQPYTGQVDLNQPELDMALFPVTGQTAAMRGDRLAPGVCSIELTYDKIFTTLVVWAVEGKPYVCLEPWTAQRNALNTGVDLIHLEPEQALEVEVKITAQVGH